MNYDEGQFDFFEENHCRLSISSTFCFLYRIKATIANAVNIPSKIHLKIRSVELLFLYSIIRLIKEIKTKTKLIITLVFVAFFMELN